MTGGKAVRADDLIEAMARVNERCERALVELVTIQKEIAEICQDMCTLHGAPDRMPPVSSMRINTASSGIVFEGSRIIFQQSPPAASSAPPR